MVNEVDTAVVLELVTVLVAMIEIKVMYITQEMIMAEVY